MSTFHLLNQLTLINVSVLLISVIFIYTFVQKEFKKGAILKMLSIVGSSEMFFVLIEWVIIFHDGSPSKQGVFVPVIYSFTALAIGYSMTLPLYSFKKLKQIGRVYKVD